MSSSGAWYTLDMGNGQTVKFQPSKWKEKIADDKFREVVFQIMNEEIIHRFDTGGGEIDIDGEE